MLRTIFVPLDGSPLAEHALPFATRLAEVTSARLVLCRIVPVRIIEPPADDLALAHEARTYMEGVAGPLTAAGRRVETITQWGDPAACIVDEVQSQQADIVVMATHGRSGPGRWVYGSVADAVLRAAPVPVVLVPPAVKQLWPSGHLDRIVVPLDGSSLSEAALGPAQELARKLDSEIVLVSIVPFPPYSVYDNGAAMSVFEPEAELAESERYLKDFASRAISEGIQVRTYTELQQPVVAIANVADQEQAGLIVMATHGRSGLARLVLGSVATGTLQRTRVPLMLVGPGVLRREAATSTGPAAILSTVG